MAIRMLVMDQVLVVKLECRLILTELSVMEQPCLSQVKEH